MFKKLLLITIAFKFLLFSCSFAKADADNLTNIYLQPGDTIKGLFIDIGAGVGAWYKSEQPEMKTYKLPIHIFAEIGKKESSLSYFLNFEFHTNYVQDFILLKPSTLSAGIKYSFAKLLNLSQTNFDVFFKGGLNYWMSKLTYKNNESYVE
ncbi:MAG: hypothetical protein GY756_03910, partial [bacterium]|nr:hypothetical protein [bacterium]